MTEYPNDKNNTHVKPEAALYREDGTLVGHVLYCAGTLANDVHQRCILLSPTAQACTELVFVTEFDRWLPVSLYSQEVGADLKTLLSKMFTLYDNDIAAKGRVVRPSRDTVASLGHQGWGVGDREHAKSFAQTVLDDGTVIELIHGEHPHSRQTNTVYARMPDGRVECFDGYRNPMSVEIREFNYMKRSSLTDNEVRKGVQWRIWQRRPDNVQRLLWTGFARTMDQGIRDAQVTLDQLAAPHESHYGTPHEDIVGSKVYYRSDLCVIDTLMTPEMNSAQGPSVLLRTLDGQPFTPPPWADEHYERGDILRVELFSPHICWHVKEGDKSDATLQ